MGLPSSSRPPRLGCPDTEGSASTIDPAHQYHTHARGHDEMGRSSVAESEQTKPKMRKLCRLYRVCRSPVWRPRADFMKTKPKMRRLRSLYYLCDSDKLSSFEHGRTQRRLEPTRVSSSRFRVRSGRSTGRRIRPPDPARAGRPGVRRAVGSRADLAECLPPLFRRGRTPPPRRRPRPGGRRPARDTRPPSLNGVAETVKPAEAAFP
jgi:hypothetical protein